MSRSVNQRPTWLMPVVILVSLVLIIGVGWWALGPETSEQSSPQDAPPIDQDAGDSGVVDVVQPEEGSGLDLTHIERRDPDDPLAAGEVDAPVVLVVFSDYQCPFCALWSTDTLPVMMEYVDRGELRIEWRDLNVYGEISETASAASYAAGLQGKFWEFHEHLYGDADILPEEELAQDALDGYAQRVGLDMDQFHADMGSEQTASALAENQELGFSMGAYSTPAFVVGGQPMIGAQPTDVFVDAVDQALAEAN